jgi:hypothetical protein
MVKEMNAQFTPSMLIFAQEQPDDEGLDITQCKKPLDVSHTDTAILLC